LPLANARYAERKLTGGRARSDNRRGDHGAIRVNRGLCASLFRVFIARPVAWMRNPLKSTFTRNTDIKKPHKVLQYKALCGVTQGHDAGKPTPSASGFRRGVALHLRPTRFSPSVTARG
jgi:hypothetical protein